MRPLIYSLVFSLAILCSCTTTNNSSNVFSSDMDTLVIKSEKVMGRGLFKLGASAFRTLDISVLKEIDWWSPPQHIPDNLHNVEYSFFEAHWSRPIRFYSPEDEGLILQDYNKGDFMITIITGQINGDTVFIVDQNLNLNLTDDSVRTFQEYDWTGLNSIIKCTYTIPVEEQEIEATGWLHIGKSKKAKAILRIVSQHMIANIKLGNHTFQLGVASRNSNSFGFIRPVLSLLGQEGITRDTLIKRDYVETGEFVKLGDNFYKFHDFYNGDGTIILKKEKNYDSIIGNQVGLKAPEFTFKTIHGDTISSDAYQGRQILIANMSWCGPSSYDNYKDIAEKFSEKMVIIGFGSYVKEDLGGIMLDAEEPFNEDMYNKYRNAFSSYDCFLIGEEGKIIDKFSIFKWKKHLSEY